MAIQRTFEDGAREREGRIGEPLGLPPAETQAALQADVFKELINKLAWVLGSTYRVRYNAPTSGARQAAMSLARIVLKGHGYPAGIARGGAKDK